MRHALVTLATIFTLAPIFTLALPNIAAAADKSGTTGNVSAVELNADASEDYLKYHGRLYVQDGGGRQQEYRWGGTSCGNKTLDASLVALLVDALRGKKLQVTPRYKDGQGGIRCLVGVRFEEVRRDDGKDKDKGKGKGKPS